ncbi:glycosyltransferase [Flavobacterium sharifuzzamanii]|uniref:glycosyltransferase n=1 Tax=Flavobacterium sharifuzzamanii TaxID=2211133 RepID=UPI000DAEDFF3|nr:glycosyltransferase [Flavobacterium sharifuzzamanii]KAF2081174.1 glycosyltransferase [Flavobacterium sharifuzzamanii]
MISIIICSRKPQIQLALLENISETIGCVYELIVIDNSENKHSIFEAYNQGIKQSKGNYWCFIHDDILFHSKDWGKMIIQIFEENQVIGLIGIAGAKVKTKMPSAWWDCPDTFKVLNIIQHLNPEKKEYWNSGWKDHHIEEVVTIDGVFMAARRDDAIQFSRELKDFHNYDLNLCFEYLKLNYKIVVSKNILLEHFSLGKLNKSWYLSALKFHQIYNQNLPVTTGLIDGFNLRKAEFDNGAKFLISATEYINVKAFFKLWMKLIIIKPKSKRHFTFFKLLIKKCLL